MKTLGINIGSTSLKMVLLDNNNIVWSGVLPHEGDFSSIVDKLMAEAVGSEQWTVSVQAVRPVLTPVPLVLINRTKICSLPTHHCPL
jgi:hypothetical protein